MSLNCWNWVMLAILAIPMQTGMQMDAENLQEYVVSET